jgi:O-antigen/teichoic acid export membrane protein
VGEPLLRLAYGQRYLEAVPTLAVLALGSLGVAASQPVRLLLVGGGRSGVYIMGMCLAAAVSVLGNLLLVPAHGAMGAAVAKGLAQGAVAVGFLAYAWRRMGTRPPLARLGRLLLACAGMAAGVRLLGRGLSPVPSLLMGVPAGVLLFVLLARWLRLLDVADAARLDQVAGMVPARARRSLRALIAFVAPSGR